jgi:hypothetical protein
MGVQIVVGILTEMDESNYSKHRIVHTTAAYPANDKGRHNVAEELAKKLYDYVYSGGLPDKKEFVQKLAAKGWWERIYDSSTLLVTRANIETIEYHDTI